MTDTTETIEELPKKQLLQMVIVYLIGNLVGLAFIFFLVEPIYRSGKFEFWLIFLIAVPFPFTAVPIASLDLALKAGVYRQHFENLRWTLIIQLVTITTWAAVMLVWLKASGLSFAYAYQILSYWLFLATHP